MKIGRSVSAAIATHAGLDTGVHGAGVSTLASEADVLTLIQALTVAVKKANDNSSLVLNGGQTNSAYFQSVGKDAAALAGELLGWVTNAAKDGTVLAFEFSGCTDTPEMTTGRIPIDRIPQIKFGTYEGNGSDATREINIGFAPRLLILLGAHKDTDLDLCLWFNVAHESIGDLGLKFPEGGAIATADDDFSTYASGFKVNTSATADNEANVNLEPYAYVAIGEFTFP